MTPGEFVAKYGITGGAESMKSTTNGDARRIVYQCVFSFAGRDGKFAINYRVCGDSPHLADPFTPVTFVCILLAQVTRNPRFAPTGAGQKWISYTDEWRLNYTEEDVARIRKWMGDAMWSDFLTIMPV